VPRHRLESDTLIGMGPRERVKNHYNRNPESDRFSSPHGRLEYERTKTILGRYLPERPTDILDVAGGTGAYSFWLADLGHRVSFVDLSDGQVASVADMNRAARSKILSMATGSALALDFSDKSFDIVLNMGPLYHLPAAEDRLQALSEMRRVLRDDGLLVSAYISRFASLMDGYRKRLILDPAFPAIVRGDLKRGVHDPPNDDEYFTLAYFHRPEEITPELRTAGFRIIEVLAVEGFFWTYPHLNEFVDEPDRFNQVLEFAAQIESEPSVMGASAHLLSMASKELVAGS
jgi:SAM-dependent methyltransferase